MKKAIALIMVLVMLLALCACTYRYEAEEGGFSIMYGSFLSERNPDGACVYMYTWDGDESNMDIVIPDEYELQTIKTLGGCYGRGAPAPFCIDDTSWMGMHDDNEDVHSTGAVGVPYDMLNEYPGVDIVYHDFSLYIGKNVDEIIGNPCAVVYTVDGVKTAYCPRVTVYCDEENDTFYSENGKLYYRENGELAEEFIYAE